MSKFSRFFKNNKVIKLNEKHAVTDSLCDENGSPLEWEFRHISSKDNENIRESCTYDVQVTGKPNMFRPKINTSKYGVKMVAASVVFPDLYDKELQDSYGVTTPEDLIYAMVDDPGEYQALVAYVQKFQGFTKSFEEDVDEAKN